eukprot:Nitzschia sp. Nitz4//scaffold54_size114964//109605//112248//NITZ4_003875-RA/size114964-augustus-gene-0.26-mRNA-1//-1//CDS//3329554423//3636//frame0
MTEVGSSEAALKRFTEWNTEALLKLLKKVVAKREASGKGGWDDDPEIEVKPTVAEEVVDVIELPPFDKNASANPKEVDVPEMVVQQLKEYVSDIAQAYRPNPYHCLQHASHTTMSAAKLISRISTNESGEDANSDFLAAHFHNQTYGIMSDPLTQFAMVMAALVHCVDHRGISNEALEAEDPEIFKKFHGVAVTEQLSFQKAWNRLMAPEFENLRRCIYADKQEKQRFRQVMLNCVFATAHDDAETQAQRQDKWDKIFGPGAIDDDDLNSKATGVLECLMQASSEFHAMQHWHVYIKWNERGFEEATKAFKAGRIPTDPAKTWYRDELNKFDNFVIPLSMQMKDIDAFVVSSDEYLNYALKNRQRWASNGREIVAALVANYSTGSKNAKVDLIKAISKESGEAVVRSAAETKHLQRLVDWNYEFLAQLLKQIIAKREAAGKPTPSTPPKWLPEEGKCPIEEVVDVIEFPPFDPTTSAEKLAPTKVQLSPEVASQLKEYVLHVSSKFNDNPFHCLDHASYVSMTAKKLLGRFIHSHDLTPEEAHKETFGLISDPMTQFAAVFSALIHDVEHPGIPNFVLVESGDDLAKKFKNRSVIEQNSIDLAWKQLMQPEFEDLLAAICADEAELMRFRQILVKTVVATDFSDSELVERRAKRWEKAFGDASDDINLKATIAIVLISQSSDYFHAIQHWAVFKKWNERYFVELHAAFESGKIKVDPATTYYKRQLELLENHIIPLCNSMKQLGVFGSSADEFLAFATTNKDKWAADGEQIVKDMAAKLSGDEEARKNKVAQRMSLTAH